MTSNLIVEKICRVDGFEFSSEERADAHVRREAVIEKLAGLIRSALSALDDEEASGDDPHLVRRLENTKHPMGQTRSLRSADSVPNATLVARAMAINPEPFREALDLIEESSSELTNTLSPLLKVEA